MRITFDEKPPLPWPVDPEPAFLAFIASTIVLVASAGEFVLLFSQ